MRSSVLLTSALAMGAMAGPINKRYMVTEIDLEIKTVTVYVTPGQAIPTADSNSAYNPVPPPVPTSNAAPVPSEPAPVSSQPAPAPEPEPETSEVYTPPPVETPTPTPTPEYTPTPTPTPTPEPAPSSAPAPAPSTPAGEHVSGESQAELSSGAEYQAAVLFHHNQARANHGAGPLEWDASCEEWALKTAKTCVFDHPKSEEEGGPGNNGQGQNLFTVSGDSFNVTAGITESWYKGEFEIMNQLGLWGKNEIPEAEFPKVGHLTAMLWKATTKVGCVSYDCGSNMKLDAGGESTEMNKFTVCNYFSPGNMAGEYAEQVGLPQSNDLGSWLD